MKMKRSYFIILFLLLAVNLSAQQKKIIPHVYTWDADSLVETRNKVLAGDSSEKGVIEKIIRKADGMMGEANLSVTQKSAEALILSGGDPHVYASLSIYFWADSANPNGAWVRHDGSVNREWTEKYDAPRLKKFQDRVNTFTLAWWFTRQEKYAAMAAAQLRYWFLDKPTYMYPQMERAQFVPNHKEWATGTCWGIIDAEGFPGILNSVGLLELSGSWHNEDALGLKEWFRQFAQWLKESKHGLEESVQPNNHGVYYDILLASGLLYSGDTTNAKKVLNEVPFKRINRQIEPDGSMPRELARAGSFGYTCKNLDGFIRLASLAEKVNIDLWHYCSADNRSIKNAIDWTIPYLKGEKKWEWREKVEPMGLVGIFWRSSRVFKAHEMVLDSLIIPKIYSKNFNKEILNIQYPR